MAGKLTPAQQQYMDLKQQHSDCLLLFRLGDFYEIFYEDAKIAHQVLGITLTARNKNSDNPIPMAGVPHHALDKYLPGLVKAGYKVAIAEQVGQVIPGKVVERAVTQVVTPGTYIDDHVAYNFVAGIRQGGTGSDQYHLAWGDFSVGQYWTRSFDSLEGLLKHVLSLGVSELIVDADFGDKELLDTYVQQYRQMLVSYSGLPGQWQTYLERLLGVSTLDGYGKALTQGRAEALSLLLYYIEQMQHHEVNGGIRIQYTQTAGRVLLDPITLKNLEVFVSSYEGSMEHSLYGVINTTKTAMGARLLYDRLLQPIGDSVEIVSRQQRIGRYVHDMMLRMRVRKLMGSVSDLSRMTTKLIYSKPSALRLQNFRTNLETLLVEDEGVCASEMIGLGRDAVGEEQLSDYYELLNKALKDEKVSDDMDYIADGYDEEVDELRRVAYHSDDLLLAYQQEIIEHTGGAIVKLKYVTNQGYFLEVSNKDAGCLEEIANPDDTKLDFVRRQTLKSGERYVSTYLEELQNRILGAKDELRSKEMALLQDLLAQLGELHDTCSEFYAWIGELDLAVSMATLAIERDWVAPVMSTERRLEIFQGRHPVVEAFLDVDEQFVPNDTVITREEFFHLITGPNMGGKSTYLRQCALIVLLAHAGLYVPAKSAMIPLVDGIFARVGSGDVLAKKQSTFMTEMLEMANILHNATDQSFVILDELGRGTSTYDGMALAKAIIVYLCEQVKANVLFATHYHELTGLESQLRGFVNYSVSVYETDKEVVFLKKIVRGGASKSYGVDVAKLAGLPQEVIAQATEYLQRMEQEGRGDKPQQLGLSFAAPATGQSDAVGQLDALRQKISRVSVNDLRPIEALVELEGLVSFIQDLDE